MPDEHTHVHKSVTIGIGFVMSVSDWQCYIHPLLCQCATGGAVSQISCSSPKKHTSDDMVCHAHTPACQPLSRLACIGLCCLNTNLL